MKRIIAVFLVSIFLSGCGHSNAELDNALALRNKINSAKKCSFNAIITAEYDDTINSFELKCETADNDTLCFEVVAPDTIAGITGMVSQSNGNLTFDDEILAFELIVDGRLSPVSAPWLLLRMLKSGYIVACGNEGEGSHIQIEDTYSGEKILIDLYTDRSNLPIRADLIWNGKRTLSIVIHSFSVM